MHELRTPLTVIKGTLEVIKETREHAEYAEKINLCVNEVNRLNNLVDQLLLLAV
jgi:signal transduction histidine kinase